MTKTSNRKVAAVGAVRCAIYTRKSTDEGLDQEFNTLDAQRESAEAYIKSQQQEGWLCLPECYDDGGFTGGNLNRPALKRLMNDIEAGKVDCVIVYKVDRLSRSLLDFAKMMETFERHGVSFVSVTQQFNTSTSMGRLVLNVLLSFAQFEREIISERTRDKIAASRRKGKWLGGMPLLGYDIAAEGSRLVVNEDEAHRVRTIFKLYLERQSLLGVTEELRDRGWTNKLWTTKKGKQRGGRAFDRCTVHNLLTNVTYLGKIRYKEEVHEGEHDAIVDVDLWQRVQALLKRNGRTGGAAVRNKYGALLKGLLRCVPCGCAMTATHSMPNGKKRYRYYVCTYAQKRGWHTCPSKSLPAGEIEKLVVDQIKAIGRDPTLLSEVVAQARRQGQLQVESLETERRGLERELSRWNAEVRELVAQLAPDESNTPSAAQLANLQERIRNAERRNTQVRDEITGLRRDIVDEQEVAQALTVFDPVWDALTPKEQVRVLQLLIERVDYDGSTGNVSITFHPSGIKTLAVEWADVDSGDAA